jgi:hypothetical protein
MRKYIPQRTFNDFVYPNNNKAQYDVNDVVQNINPNVVSGTVTNFVATLVGGSLKVDFNYTWSKNGAEVFINQLNEVAVLSLHVMPAGVTYFKPWRCVDNLDAVSGSTSASGAYSGTFSPSLLGLPSLTSGVYYFEIRMIGLLQNYIITQQYTVAPPASPTPSMTSSPGSSASPTPTMTPTNTMTPSPSVTNTPGASVSPTPTRTMTPSPTPSPIVQTFYDVSGCTGGTGVIQYNGPDNFDGGEVVVSDNGNCYTIINGTPVSGPASSGIITSEVSDCSDPAC